MYANCKAIENYLFVKMNTVQLYHIWIICFRCLSLPHSVKRNQTYTGNVMLQPVQTTVQRLQMASKLCMRLK